MLHAASITRRTVSRRRFTREGNARLRAYCEAHGIPVNACSKLVVARNEREHASLDSLFRRGQENGIELKLVTQQEAREIEPRVRTAERALFSPSTASVDPKQVVSTMRDDAVREGVRIGLGVRFVARDGNIVRTSAGSVDAGFVKLKSFFTKRVGNPDQRLWLVVCADGRRRFSEPGDRAAGSGSVVAQVVFRRHCRGLLDGGAFTGHPSVSALARDVSVAVHSVQ